jgi:hypothetical protein
MSEKEFSVNILVDRGEQATISSQIRALGLREERPDEEGEFEPVTLTIVAIGAVSALAALIIEAIKVSQGGSYVDLTQTPPVVRREKALDAGTVLIITKDSKDGQKVTLEVNDLPKGVAERIVEAFLKAGTDITTAVAKAIIDKEKSEAEGSDTKQ